MDRELKTVFKSISLLVLVLILVVFLSEVVGIGMFKLFEPVKEDVRREVFENTKSYTHGKIQDLAKRYSEWKEAEIADRTVIEELIRLEFAAFDAEKIQSEKLKQFLTKTRGY